MSEVQSENRAISAGIPRVSDVTATSGPVQERLCELAGTSAFWQGHPRFLTRCRSASLVHAVLFLGRWPPTVSDWRNHREDTH